MEREAGRFRITTMVRVSRSGFYAWRRRRHQPSSRQHRKRLAVVVLDHVECPEARPGVIVKSGVQAVESSGGLIDVCHLDTISELDSGYHLRQVIETA